MNDQPAPENAPLRFDVAESVGPPSSTAFACANCQQSLTTDYYEIAGKMVCPACRDTITATFRGGGGKERFILATVYGLGAALAGALLWWGVRAATDYELGLIAVAVGFMVGYAVRAGAQRRGGRRYQILAVALTYLGITMNYVPDVVKGLVTHPANSDKQGGTAAGDKSGAETGDKAKAEAEAGAAAATNKSGESTKGTPGVLALLVFLVVVVGIAAAAPFLAGASNIMGILIIGFALWEAWKMNRETPLAFNGPFPIAPAAAGTEQPAGAPIASR